MIQLSAKIKKQNEPRICQCDIFHDIEVVEKITESDKGIDVSYLHFPLVICLNQDCDLNSDARDKGVPGSNKDCRLIHLLVAPLFNFDEFRNGSHWGELFQIGDSYNPNKTKGERVIQNKDERFHFLHFDPSMKLPDMVIDFKHFFSVNTQYLYDNLDKRVCSLSEVYREKICQRFAFYFSRIGLPD